MNCEQYGSTFRSAFTLLYLSRISGRAFPAFRQALNLKTGISFSAAAFAEGENKIYAINFGKREENVR